MSFIARKEAMWPGKLQRTSLQDPVLLHLDLYLLLRLVLFLSFTMTCFFWTVKWRLMDTYPRF